MRIANVSPTWVSGRASGADSSIPDPSTATWPAGSATIAKTADAGAAMRRLADARSEAIAGPYWTA